MSESLVLRNVKRISGEIIDIAVEDGIITAISPANTGEGQQVIDYHQAYVSSGWIDMHVHAFPEFDPYGDEIDEIGYKQGVTTIIDAGSTGADRFSDLVTNSQKAKTNLFAFLNISRIGLQRTDELSDMSWLDDQKIAETLANYKDIIVGLKARISKSVVGGNGLKPLEVSRKFSDDTGLPIMVHIGSGPPDINDIVEFLNEGDVITHYLNGKDNNLFTNEDKPLTTLVEAVKRGVRLDVGHGTASFSFPTAEAAKENGIHFDTISTDIYRGNRLNGPVYSMAHVLTKFLALGYSLSEVIDAVTVKAAEWLEKPELGRIQVGDKANLTIFSLEKGKITLVDSEGKRRNADQQIKVRGVVVNGEHIER